MRFQYVDRSGRKVEVQSLEGLAARLELGAITPETMLYDAVADRWAPAAEHEFFRSLVRPPGRETNLPVTPPGVVPSTDTVDPVMGPSEGAPEGPDPEATAVDAEEPGLPGEGHEESDDPEAEGVLRAEPPPQASFAEVKEGSAAAHSPLFGLMDLEEAGGEEEIADPFADALELSVLPEAPPGPTPAPTPELRDDRAGDLPDDLPGSDPAAGGGATAPPSEVSPGESHSGPRELTLDDLGEGGREAEGESPLVLQMDTDPGTPGRGGPSGGVSPGGVPAEGDWRYVPGGPPPAPLKGVEVAPSGEDEEEGYFRATRSGTGPLDARRASGARGRGFDPVPLLRNAVLALALLAVVWAIGGRWGPWATPRDRIPTELQAPFMTAWNGAYGDLLQAMDSMSRVRELPERPGRDWLEGVYLAYASRFASEGDYWTGLGTLIRDFRVAEDSIFSARIRARVGALRLSDAQGAMLVGEALRRFEAARPERARVYSRAEGIAAAAAELHGLLVQHEEEILYEPFTVSGVSRDPVIEAVPTNRPLAETMWSLIDQVTRGLQDMDAIMGVSTRGFVDAVLRELRSADPTRIRPPGSPSPGG